MMTGRTRKAILFLCVAAAAAAQALEPLLKLMRAGPHGDYYTHIPLIPLISAYVLFRRRNRDATGEASSPLAGIAVAALGLGLVIADMTSSFGLIARVELRAGGAILITVGTYLGLFGSVALRKTRFPFLFLVFMIPLPLAWMERVISALVTASAGVTHLLFSALGVPFIREGSLFRLPDFDIRVAQECSGIRSSLALLITSVLAAQIFLDRPWKKVLLALAVFPVAVFKNAVRIVSLYLLSYFVDIQIIQGGFLHRSGGFIFFGLGLAILAYLLWILKDPRAAWGRLRRLD
ncbi:MAG TPA: exosortase/archaeosortase family protein [Acidobacteriota bacterium]|nr:exosortase/archaeosortase family protein [Acidobacteriota bacterium]